MVKLTVVSESAGGASGTNFRRVRLAHTSSRPHLKLLDALLPAFGCWAGEWRRAINNRDILEGCVPVRALLQSRRGRVRPLAAKQVDDGGRLGSYSGQDASRCEYCNGASMHSVRSGLTFQKL